MCECRCPWSLEEGVRSPAAALTGCCELPSMGAEHLESLCKNRTGKQLKQWFLAFLTLQPFNSVSHVVETPNHKTIFVVTSYL